MPVDRVLAQEMFAAAAAKGHPRALLMLGRYLARGLAGETNITRARDMLSQALDAGVEEAERDLADLPPEAVGDDAPAPPDASVDVQLADLEPASAPKLETDAERPDQVVSDVSAAPAPRSADPTAEWR